MRILLFLLFVTSWASIAAPVASFFAKDTQFNSSIPTPESVLGFELGDRYVRHDQLLKYLYLVAEKSNRFEIETTGYTHEGRELVLLNITSEKNLKSLESIRTEHLNNLRRDKDLNVNSPVIIWMGYSVHGDESSGSNAALAVAYYLAAAEGKDVEHLLNNSVILLDPSLNPDGLDRFANWSNMHRGSVANADPAHREHVQDWPSGRTNHFWFDLNRDWLLLQHPESRARVSKFHQWKPNVLTDFHEMGTNSTYFFQPGIPTRTNPHTPKRNTELTKALADFHASALDDQGRLYFTQESFDDFYYGKGSTYPDVNGSVGILFEQASSRGVIQESINGDVTFEFAIQNQVTTSLSTFTGALVNKKALIEYQAKFYRDAIKDAKKDDVSGYLVTEEKDLTRLEQLLTVLHQHEINVYPLNKDIRHEGQLFKKQHSYFVPLEQAQYRLIKAIFMTDKSFQDNTFYDVSAWTLPYAYNITFQPMSGSWGLKVGKNAWQPKQDKQPQPVLESAYAYGLEWHDYKAPLFLTKALEAGIIAKASGDSFVALTNEGQKSFAAGTILFNQGVQTKANWLDLLAKIANEVELPLFAIKSGLTPTGADLGSRSMHPVTLPKVLMLGGKGVSQYEAGEAWYYMDRYLGIAPTIVELPRIGSLNLSRYTHIVMTAGDYDSLSEQAVKNIKAWVKQGGTIWGQKSAAGWLVEQKLLNTVYLSRKDMAKRFETLGLAYGDKEALQGRQRIAGAIFESKLDLSHPLAFGYQQTFLPVFKNDTGLLMPAKSPFTNVATYAPKPLLAGYTAARNIEKIATGSTLVAHNYGKGRVIGMTDNPHFRGFWYGTSRLFTNALYFSKVFSATK